ncbi:MAG TPA: phage tail family protein [Bacillus bacterium]|nr:phage tail family protein [Bacillus sp. (in: firmicutes)]
MNITGYLDGFTFNGKHSSEYGIIVTSRNIPMLSEARTDNQQIPNKDGSYDFSDGTYDDKTLSVTCEFIVDDVSSFRKKARQLAAWLITRNKVPLIFDDDNEVYYNVRLVNQIDLDQFTSIGEFTLEFKSDPFAYSVDELSVQTILNTKSKSKLEVISESTVNTPTKTIIKNLGLTTINGLKIKISTPKGS